MTLSPAFSNATLATATAVVAAAVLASSGGARAQGCAGQAAPPATATGAPEAPAGYPSFCSIPRPPTDVRSVGAFREAIVETRLAGRAATREGGPDTWTLPEDGAGAFAAQARAEAAPPPPENHGPDADAKAYSDELRRMATPPRPR